jgi:hypothetical protein
MQSLVRIVKSMRTRWVGLVARAGEKTNVYRLLVGKPDEKRPRGKPRRRWIEDIKNDFFRDRIEWCGLDWSGSE